VNKSRGFTLIELMIVIAIIAIIVAIAMLAYQDYLIKARVTEGLNLASTAQIAINEATIINNALPTTYAATTYISPNATANVSGIVIGASGIITITYTPLAGGTSSANTITLTPSYSTISGITWVCSGTLLAKYRPSTCR
jgi:type IV pilus assembly protein PilA